MTQRVKEVAVRLLQELGKLERENVQLGSEYYITKRTDLGVTVTRVSTSENIYEIVENQGEVSVFLNAFKGFETPEIVLEQHLNYFEGLYNTTIYDGLVEVFEKIDSDTRGIEGIAIESYEDEEITIITSTGVYTLPFTGSIMIGHIYKGDRGVADPIGYFRELLIGLNKLV